MRKITEKAKHAFEYGINFSNSNTQVSRTNDGSVALFLHGHKIAWRTGGKLYFSMCGWPSITTRERLQAAGINLYQYKWDQYYSEGQRVDPGATYEVIKDMGTITQV